MTIPTAADFALVSIQTAAGPPAVYALLCGIEGVNINRAAQTSDTYRRDCAVPNRPGTRKIRVTGSSWTISGSGSDNIDIDDEYEDAFGVRKTYKVELFEDDGTDGGASLGTYIGSGIMTARNQSYSQDSAGTIEITIEGEGDLAWTAAS